MEIWSANTQSTQANGEGSTTTTPPATPGLIGGMDLTTISALVVLASAFMRR
jgi:hypothetical protein